MSHRWQNVQMGADLLHDRSYLARRNLPGSG